MANELIRFKQGQIADLSSASKVSGQILFALDDNNTGSIYFDKDNSTRYRMSYNIKDASTQFSVSSANVVTYTNPNRVYPVALDKDGYLAVSIPWSNTTYSAGTGISLSGTTFSNSGVRSISTGTANGTISVNTNGSTANVSVYGLKDLAYIAKPSSNTTTTYLRGDGTWVTPPNTLYYAGTGLSLSNTTFKINLKNDSTASTLTAADTSSTSGKQYAVELDAKGYLSVNVPWTEGTVTSIATGIGLTGGTITTSGTIKANLKSETVATYDSNSITNTSGKQYAVVADKSGYLSVNVPWSNTTYSAGTGISLSGTTFSNSGVRSITTGSNNGTISVNTNGSSAEVAVKGLGTVAYTSYPSSNTTTTYLRADGTWVTPTNTLYYAGTGLMLSNTTFKIKLFNDSVASSLTVTSISSTSGRQYAVELDSAGYLSVNVPWTDNNTTYSASGNGITLSGTTFSLALVSETKVSAASNTASTASGKYYPIGLDSNGKLTVNVPWTNTTYSAGTGLSLSGTTINHSNSITAKTAAAQSAKTLTWGGTFTLYEEKYDAQGHITGVASYNMTMPANPNTDTKVTQNPATTDSEFPIILKKTASITAETNTVNFNGNNTTKQTTINPYTGRVSAYSYQVAQAVVLEYDSDTESLNFVFN